MKPVAWMYEVNDTFILFSANKPPEDAYDEGSLVPLYTAPRELSDEEIYEVWSTLPYDDQCPFDGRATYRFARAILKKASEK
jgi:hypothetical protein